MHLVCCGVVCCAVVCCAVLVFGNRPTAVRDALTEQSYKLLRACCTDQSKAHVLPQSTSSYCICIQHAKDNVNMQTEQDTAGTI